MDGFALLLGHLVGDYIVQTDWMANNKTTNGVIGYYSCFVHCICYTLSIAAFSWFWMPWWGYIVCFGFHYPIDKWRLAKWWMMNVSGQKGFATGLLSPWSIIIVDNVFHLLTLYGIWVVWTLTKGS
jgi:hypothetical protein